MTENNSTYKKKIKVENALSVHVYYCSNDMSFIHVFSLTDSEDLSKTSHADFEAKFYDILDIKKQNLKISMEALSQDLDFLKRILLPLLKNDDSKFVFVKFVEAGKEVFNNINGKLNVDMGKMSQSEIGLMIISCRCMMMESSGTKLFQRLKKGMPIR